MSVGLLALLSVVGQAPKSPAVEAELAFVYGFGSRSAFGAMATVDVALTLWETPGAEGTLQLGVMGGYQHEPFTLSAALIAPSVVTGGNHRGEALAIAGHTFRLLPSRRLLVGLQVFAGWTQVSMVGTLSNTAQGVSRAYRADGGEFTMGTLVLAGVQVHQRVAVVGRFILPIPYQGVAVSSYFMASLGAALRF